MKLIVDGNEIELAPSDVTIKDVGDRLQVQTPEGTFSAVVVRHGETTYISYRGQVYEVEKPGRRSTKKAEGGNGTHLAQLPGAVVDVLVSVGDTVENGQRLLVMEAMKVQQPITAPFDGTVAELPVTKGQQVSEGDLLVRIEKA